MSQLPTTRNENSRKRPLITQHDCLNTDRYMGARRWKALSLFRCIYFGTKKVKLKNFVISVDMTVYLSVSKGWFSNTFCESLCNAPKKI